MSAVDMEWMAVNRMFKTVKASLANSRLEESVDFFKSGRPSSVSVHLIIFLWQKSEKHRYRLMTGFATIWL
jgi:hypothetical protein